MTNKEFIKIFQQVAKQNDITVSQDDVRMLLKILEQSCLLTGIRLDVGEKVTIGKFLTIEKIEKPPKPYVIQWGDRKGEKGMTKRKIIDVEIEVEHITDWIKNYFIKRY